MSFGYDLDGLLTRAGALTLSRELQNGLLTGSTLGGVADALGYNVFGELSAYSASFNTTGIFATEYVRDEQGRITQKTETIDGMTEIYAYEYDLAGRLTDVSKNGAPISHYDYDTNGNRLSHTGPNGTVTGANDDQDRLLSYGDAIYAYTANGELQSKTKNGKTTTYVYDVSGNLVSATLPDSTRVEYVIDVQNRRVGKKVNGVLIQGFLYKDQINPVAELDGNGNVVARFVHGSRAHVPDYPKKVRHHLPYYRRPSGKPVAGGRCSDRRDCPADGI